MNETRPRFTKPPQHATLGTAFPAGRPDVAFVRVRPILEMVEGRLIGRRRKDFCFRY